MLIFVRIAFANLAENLRCLGKELVSYIGKLPRSNSTIAASVDFHSFYKKKSVFNSFAV